LRLMEAGGIKCFIRLETIFEDSSKNRHPEPIMSLLAQVPQLEE